jgi:peptide/nickel transport system permease protein
MEVVAMFEYVARRMLQVIPVIILVSIMVFAMVRLIPGDPAMVLIGPDAPPELVIETRAKMALDRPMWEQYIAWVRRLMQGDFGVSFVNGFPVSRLIAMKLPATIELAIAALILATLISFPLGIISALRQGHLPDHVVTLYTSLAMGIPSFWLAILLVLTFSLKLKVLPPSGYVSVFENPIAGLRFIILPACTLAFFMSAVFVRFIRSSILETLFQDYVRVAHAKGLPPGLVIRRHVLKNALIPVLTVFGVQFGALLGGAVITESIFDWPGVGRLLVQSISTRDYNIVQVLILMAVTVYVLVNLVTDLLYGVIDPRISKQG